MHATAGDGRNLAVVKALTFLMFTMFAMTTDSVGLIIPEVVKTYRLSLTAAGTSVTVLDGDLGDVTIDASEAAMVTGGFKVRKLVFNGDGSAVLDVIRLDYVTTARAKGLAERAVVMKHVVRNAMIPVVTLVALQMPIVFGGAIVTEILESAELAAQWRTELTEMRDRINGLRQDFVDIYFTGTHTRIEGVGRQPRRVVFAYHGATRDRQFPAEVEKVVLDLDQACADVFRHRLREDEPDATVQLVDFAERTHASGALLLRNLPMGHVPATPPTPTARRRQVLSARRPDLRLHVPARRPLLMLAALGAATLTLQAPPQARVQTGAHSQPLRSLEPRFGLRQV